MEPYYQVEDAVYAGMEGEDQYRVGQWLAGTPEQKAALEREYPQLIRKFRLFVADQQINILSENTRESEEWNRAHPQFNPRESMQKIAQRWSIRNKPYSLEEHEHYQRLIDEVDIDSINVIEPRKDIPPIYMP